MIERELTCQEFVELVTDYLDMMLPEEDRARFEAHLADCPSCSTYLEQIRQTIRLTGHLTEESVSGEIMDVMLQHFRTWTRPLP